MVRPRKKCRHLAEPVQIAEPALSRASQRCFRKSRLDLHRKEEGLSWPKEQEQRLEGNRYMSTRTECVAAQTGTADQEAWEDRREGHLPKPQALTCAVVEAEKD